VKWVKCAIFQDAHRGGVHDKTAGGFQKRIGMKCTSGCSVENPNGLNFSVFSVNRSLLMRDFYCSIPQEMLTKLGLIKHQTL